ncbi:hypothetical protein HQQ80_21375 [Microbacteriaceae bacterium VKM Ac-2855]|nr:hypothetical protein [Microbacteriaceae bacterium VKM Ac-2855]
MSEESMGDAARKFALAERLARIESQPLPTRAVEYAALTDELRERLEESDARR